MNLPFLSLQVVWDFIGPIVQDLLQEGGKKLLMQSKKPTAKEDFYKLHEVLGEFNGYLEAFVDELSKFLALVERKAERDHKLKDFDRYPLGEAGVTLSKSLMKLEAALKEVDPEFDIYAHDIKILLRIVWEEEWTTLKETQDELVQLRTSESPLKYGWAYYGPGDGRYFWPTIEGIDVGQLRRQLANAKTNLELSTRSINQLRAFIRDNIPLKLE